MYKRFYRYFPLFVLPILVAFVISFAIPFVMGIYLSFCDFTTVSDARFVGLENYREAFGVSFTHSLWYTSLFSLLSVITVNLFAFFLAQLLTRGIRGTNFFRTVFFMPNLIGGIVLGYIWQIIINGLLRYYGVDITFSEKYGFFGMLILTNWQLVGYMMIIYVAALQNIPGELREAAAIDGATSRMELKHITLPLTMPSITVCTFLTLTNTFKLFDQNLALTAGAPNKRSALLALDIYNTFYGSVGSEGVGQAKAVIFTLILTVIAILQLRLTKRREREI
jgi:raffinose/stachyose/melibiose transport system permease protein